MIRIAAILMFILPTIASAQSINCSNIDDPDQRHFCRAVTMNNIAECGTIRDHGIKTQCNVRLGRTVLECASIMDPEQRTQCQMMNQGNN